MSNTKVKRGLVVPKVARIKLNPLLPLNVAEDVLKEAKTKLLLIMFLL